MKILLKSILVLSWFLLNITSCHKKKKKEANLHNKGEITLQHDDAYINIAEALTYRYQQAYPDTKINLKISKEDQALEDLLNKKVNIIIMSRELTSQERAYWDQKKLPWQPSYFAADAVCLITNIQSPKSHITLDEIKEMLISEDRKLIFEGRNTSNFNAIINKLKLNPKEISYSKLEGNENIIKSLKKYPKHIGVISYNTISNPYNKNIEELKKHIKILPIKVEDSLIFPNKSNLKSQKYPLTKLLYFLTNEEKFGLANGLIRYSATQIGQKIVNKEGLQPYFIYPRTIKINTQN